MVFGVVRKEENLVDDVACCEIFVGDEDFS